MNNFKPKKRDSLNDPNTKSKNAKKYHKMREKLSEKQIDKMIKDSFPASDPPSTY